MRIRSEYLMEAGLLGTFMVSACVFTALLQHPASPLATALPDPFVRRALTGLAMGLTAISLIYSPMGRRSGAHMNPSITFTYMRLGKVETRDALAYIAAQFAGGALGVLLVGGVFGNLAAHPSVRFAVTEPGMRGEIVAFGAEMATSFLMMAVVLCASNSKRFTHYTGLLAGTLVATYITFESPFSGMSMNPARSFASALAVMDFSHLWIYFVAPPLGMLLAAEAYTRIRGARRVYCAKFDHPTTGSCIFRCNYRALGEASRTCTTT
ncbi:MAG: MIP/aquaporin family protein [Candidatus Binataceae bacterium]